MFENIKKKIKSDMSKEEIVNIINTEGNEFISDVKRLTDEIKNGKNKKEIIDEIKKDCAIDNFADIIIKNVSRDIIPYEETVFLRNMDINTFTELTEYMFKNTIIQREDIKTIIDKTKLTNKDINCTKKMLNTILNFIIIKRYTFANYKSQAIDIFRFDNQKIEKLWDLFIDNKQDLINIIVLENNLICNNIQNDIVALFNTLKSAVIEK